MDLLLDIVMVASAFLSGYSVGFARAITKHLKTINLRYHIKVEDAKGRTVETEGESPAVEGTVTKNNETLSVEQLKRMWGEG